MRGTDFGAKLQAQNAARRQAEAIVRRLSVDQVVAGGTGGRFVRDLRAIASALFADDEDKADPRLTLATQLLGRGNLRRQNALGVARAATIQAIAVDAAREKGGHAIDVRREGDAGVLARRRRRPAIGDDVEPRVVDALLDDGPTAST